MVRDSARHVEIVVLSARIVGFEPTNGMLLPSRCITGSSCVADSFPPGSKPNQEPRGFED